MGSKSLKLSFLVVIVVVIATFAVSTPLWAQTADTSPEAPDTPPLRGGDTSTQFQFGYNAYHRDGDLETARRRFEAALQSDTSYMRARFWLGKVYYALGYNDSAVKTWRPGKMLTGAKQKWFSRVLNLHQLSYNPPQISDLKNWNFVSGIKGKVLGKNRNVNPIALTNNPGGGFYTASFRMNKVLYYSEEGKLLNQWYNFEKPAALSYLSGKGLLVAEFGGDRIRLITDTGAVVPFARAGVNAPYELFTQNQQVYVFNDGSDEIYQLTSRGDTLGRVWKPPPLVRIDDLALSPAGKFWLLDLNNNRIIIVNTAGKRLREIEVDPGLGIRKLWWRQGELFAGGENGFMKYTPGEKPLYLRDRGEIIPGEDISDCLFSGDRLIISRFKDSNILIYRPQKTAAPDILVQSRRTQFEDYPVIRMNLLLRDPLRSSRFQHLSDNNLGIKVEGFEALPSYLRKTRSYYTPGWIILVDNCFKSRERWDEIRPFIEKLITRAPDDTEGTIWKVYSENNFVVAPMTGSKIKLRNRLNSMHPYKKGKKFDPVQLRNYLHRTVNGAFRRRGPTGIIVVSTRIDNEGSQFNRLARRLRNNGLPLTIINPSISKMSSSSPLLSHGNTLYMNFSNLSTGQVWQNYNRTLQHHYTTVYRSPLNALESGAWRKFEYSFHYLDVIYRFSGGYLLP